MGSSGISAGTQDQNFEPFSPELASSSRPMNIIQNLPNAKECEFDHQYIAQHLKQVPGSTLSMDIEPYKTLKTPYYHMKNLGINHPPNRPRGQVHIKRVFKMPQGNKEFTHTAKMSSLSALRTLQDKPAMAKEVTYKLRADANNGVLIKLS